jgi:hypothetical protein
MFEKQCCFEILSSFHAISQVNFVLVAFTLCTCSVPTIAVNTTLCQVTHSLGRAETILVSQQRKRQACYLISPAKAKHACTTGLINDTACRMHMLPYHIVQPSLNSLLTTSSTLSKNSQHGTRNLPHHLNADIPYRQHRKERHRSRPK